MKRFLLVDAGHQAGLAYSRATVSVEGPKERHLSEIASRA